MVRNNKIYSFVHARMVPPLKSWKDWIPNKQDRNCQGQRSEECAGSALAPPVGSSSPSAWLDTTVGFRGAGVGRIS